MHLTDLIHRREQEAQKIAQARGRAKSWDGTYHTSHDDRVLADEVVKAELTLVPR